MQVAEESGSLVLRLLLLVPEQRKPTVVAIAFAPGQMMPEIFPVNGKKQNGALAVQLYPKGRVSAVEICLIG